MKKNEFDLLTTVETGGCSAKIPAQLLEGLLRDLPVLKNNGRLLVGMDTHDDAAVWKISDDTAIIQTTDFFPPLCSDPFEFGQIAAANALSDVFAMGGDAICAMNLVMFPSAKIDTSVLKEILRGGAEKVAEAGTALVGGHTIDDYPPKYGLAVMGTVHPKKIISNAGAKPGDVLILTKPIGTGIILAGQKIGDTKHLQRTLDGMKVLNKDAAAVMQKFNVRSATDITGFGLLGHALRLAQASGVSLKIDSNRVPLLAGALELAKTGCIPGAAFRNLKFVEAETLFQTSCDFDHKMILCDAQTSGGILMCCKQADTKKILSELASLGHDESLVIGSVERREETGKRLSVF